MVADLGWVGFDLDVLPSYPAVRPNLQNSQLPRQNRADSGTSRIQVNPTKVHDHQIHPVVASTQMQYLLRRDAGREHKQSTQSHRRHRHHRPPRQSRRVVERAKLLHHERHGDRLQTAEVKQLDRLLRRLEGQGAHRGSAALSSRSREQKVPRQRRGSEER